MASLDIDASGNVWICSYSSNNFLRLNVNDHSIENFDHVLEIGNDNQPTTYLLATSIIKQTLGDYGTEWVWCYTIPFRIHS